MGEFTSENKIEIQRKVKSIFDKFASKAGVGVVVCVFLDEMQIRINRCKNALANENLSRHLKEGVQYHLRDLEYTAQYVRSTYDH